MRVTVSLTGDEHDKLRTIAHAQRRTVRDQAAHVIARWLDDALVPGEAAEGAGGGDDPASTEGGRTDGRAS